VIGALLVALLVAPWFLITLQAIPPDEEMSVLSRYKYQFNLGESRKQHRDDWHEVVRIVGVGGLPWSAAAAVGLFFAFPPRRRELAVGFAGPLVGITLFYALAEAKMGHFYGAMQPAVAGLAALGLTAMVRRLHWRSLAALAALLTFWWNVWNDASQLLWTATVKNRLYDVDITVAATGMLLAWLLIVAAAVAAERPRWVVAAVLPAALLAGLLGQRVVPALEEKKSLGPLWRAYVERREPGEPVGFLGPSKDSIFYYSNNAVQRFKEVPPTIEFLRQPGVKFIIMPKKSSGHFIGEVPGQWDLLHKEHPVYALLRHAPRPAQ
jgi:hypothetical protein